MKCPYCAEEIQDAALLCRFCGARRVGERWQEPTLRVPTVARADFTIASTGWLLLGSGLWSLATLTAPAPILGGLSGMGAVLYNLLFAGLFGAMGFALARRKPWALPITLATSVAYTIDKFLFILDESAQLSALGEAGELVGELGPALGQVTRLVSVLFLLGWWGFVLYLYRKRAYFHADVPGSVARAR